MSVPTSALPDLSIWDSIRVCANGSLKTLVQTIEGEISRDLTLAELRKTASARMAIEARARTWMVRAYACCLSCWRTQLLKEETTQFRNAIYFYGLSLFFSKEMLPLLRLAAGVTEETRQLLDNGQQISYLRPDDTSALSNASDVYTKLMTSWIADLPPIPVRTTVEPQTRGPIVSKAPRPPTVVGGNGCTPSRPNPVELPLNFPPDFPSSLTLKAMVILADMVKELPDRSKLEEFGRALVSRLTELLCTGIRSKILTSHGAPDHLQEILRRVLVANCDRDNERFAVQRGVINSDEWRAMLKKLLECEEELEQSSREANKSKKTAPPNRDRIEAFMGNMQEHGHTITKSDIWRAAGYRDPTEFERFQREDARSSSGASTKFDRILNLPPDAFIQKLQKLGLK